MEAHSRKASAVKNDLPLNFSCCSVQCSSIFSQCIRPYYSLFCHINMRLVINTSLWALLCSLSLPTTTFHKHSWIRENDENNYRVYQRLIMNIKIQCQLYFFYLITHKLIYFNFLFIIFDKIGILPTFCTILTKLLNFVWFQP